MTIQFNRFYFRFFLIASLILFSSFQKIDISKHEELIDIQKNQALNEIFPIKEIIEIKVTNYSGQYVLNGKELIDIKSHVGTAKYTGGLLVKPGHIFLKFKLKGNKDGGYVYVKNDLINFDTGKNLKGQNFSGSFRLNNSINFDNFH